MAKNDMSAKRPSGLSLFSGAGGLDLGAINAGVDIRGCIENDPHACDTLRLNHRRLNLTSKVIEASITDILPVDVADSLSLRENELDVLFGGPPCQSFSQIGKRGALTDPRGLLLFKMVDYAAYFKPNLVVIENVRGLLSAPGIDGHRGGAFKLLRQELSDLGYLVTYGLLNSADYGVPQRRQRLFIIAGRTYAPRLPNPSHHPAEIECLPIVDYRPYVTIDEALRNLPGVAPKGSDSTDSHIDITPDGDRRRIRGVPEGMHLSGCLDLPLSQRGKLTRKDTTKFLRLSRDTQANTLRCGEIFFHPLEDRYLTPREYMRIHGFPDDYLLSGPIRGRSGSAKTLDQHRLVANSVPPPLAEAIFKSLLGDFDGGLADSLSRSA